MTDIAIISNPIGALNQTVQTAVHNSALMSIQYITTQPAQFAGSDVYALFPNIYSSSIITDIQATALNPALINQPAEFVGSDISSLFPNIETIVNVTVLQPPTWVPGVDFAPQTPLFAGSDLSALLANQWSLGAPPYLQTATWIPSVVQPNPALFVGSDISALIPNTIWNVPNNYLQAPEWLLLPAQPVQPTSTIIASLLPNLYPLPQQLNWAQEVINVVEIRDNILWHLVKTFVHYVIFVTENLGLVTETVVKHTSSFLTESLGSVGESVQKGVSKYLVEALGACTEQVSKAKHVFINIIEQDSTVSTPVCPPGQLYDPSQGKCVTCGTGTGRPAVRDIGGRRKLAIHRKPTI